MHQFPARPSCSHIYIRIYANRAGRACWKTPASVVSSHDAIQAINGGIVSISFFAPRRRSRRRRSRVSMSYIPTPCLSRGDETTTHSFANVEERKVFFVTSISPSFPLFSRRSAIFLLALFYLYPPPSVRKRGWGAISHLSFATDRRIPILRKKYHF